MTDDRLAALVAAQVSDAELAQIVAEARAEALAELRARLKDALLADLLGRLARQEAAAPAASEASLTPSPAHPRGAERSADPHSRGAERSADPHPRGAERSADLDDAAIRAELAALRAQLQASRGMLAPGPPPAPPPAQQVEIVDVEAEPAAGPEPEEGLYVYAVMRAGVELPAIGGVAPGAPLELLPHGDLAAIVSRVPLAEFGERALEANARDIDWLERVVRAHQGALESLLPAGPMVPLRFGTIYVGAAGVAAVLDERAGELRAALARLEGRSEWGLKLYADEAALGAHALAATPALRELAAQIAARPPGAAYMLQRKLERMAAAEAERIAAACVDAAHARLGARAVAAVSNPLRERQAGEPLMLLNAAYLVADAGQAAFDAELDQLRELAAPLGISFARTGPWPPYSFAAGPAEEVPIGGTAIP